MSVRPSSGLQNTAPLLAFQRAPEADVGVSLLGDNKKRIEELKNEYLRLEGEVSRLKAQMTRIDQTVTTGNYRNIETVAKQQQDMLTRLGNVEFMAQKNRADKSQFFMAIRVIMSNLLLGKRPVDVSLEEEALLRSLGIHKEFNLSRREDGRFENAYVPIQGFQMMKAGATESDRFDYYFLKWGRADSAQ